MNNQYYAPRRKGGSNPHGIGTIAVGTIIYIQDRIGRYESPICREPWIVEAWTNREYHPAVNGAPHTTYMAGGHLAIVRSLRTGRRQRAADHILRACDDLGLTAA